MGSPSMEVLEERGDVALMDAVSGHGWGGWVGVGSVVVSRLYDSVRGHGSDGLMAGLDSFSGLFQA